MCQTRAVIRQARGDISDARYLGNVVTPVGSLFWVAPSFACEIVFSSVAESRERQEEGGWKGDGLWNGMMEGGREGWWEGVGAAATGWAASDVSAVRPGCLFACQTAQPQDTSSSCAVCGLVETRARASHITHHAPDAGAAAADPRPVFLPTVGGLVSRGM